MHRKSAGTFAVSLLCAAAVAACGGTSNTKSSTGTRSASSATNKAPVVVSLISFKLPALDFIDQYDLGAQAAANVVNAHGGFGGRPLKLITCNSMLQPAATTACAHQTLAQHPVAELGCENSWSAAGIPLYSSASVPSLNCPGSQVDFSSPWNFGIGTGTQGIMTGMASYICSQMPQVKRVAYIEAADPEQEHDVPLSLTPVLKGCGKQLAYTWVPTTTIDMTPVVAKILQSKPDFILTAVSGSSMIQLAKALQQQGFPASRLQISDSALDATGVLKPLGSALNGAYVADEFAGWGLSGSPDATAYQRATHGAVAAENGNSVSGYVDTMLMYTAAKTIGFAKFNAASLTHFLRTANSIHIPMSRTLVNPGPASAPSVKQPYVQLMRWQHGKMTLITQGTDGGWVKTAIKF